MNIYQKIVSLFVALLDKIAPFAPKDLEVCEWCSNRAMCTSDMMKTCKDHPNNFKTEEKNEHNSSHAKQ